MKRTIVLTEALHARPANLLVRLAAGKGDLVVIRHGERTANARHILDVLGLAAGKGDEIEISGDGEGYLAVVRLVEQGFDADLVPETGAIAAAGIGIGKAHVLVAAHAATPETLDEAFARARREIRQLIATLPRHEAELFEPEVAILAELEPRVRARMGEAGSFAEAVEIETSGSASDLLLDARARLTSCHAPLPHDLGPFVLVAEELAPSLVAALPPTVQAIVASRGGAAEVHGASGTSHAAILARSREIPLAFVPEHVVLSVTSGDLVVVDTTDTEARVWISPGEAVVRDAEARLDARREEKKADELAEATIVAHLPIKLKVNLSSADERIPAGTDGVGLVRTELVFARRTTRPGMDEQSGVYGRIAKRTEGRPVNLRLFDAGFDKPLAWLPAPPSDPEARGAALLLLQPDVLRSQLAAITLAHGAHAGIRALVPLVEDDEQMRAVRAALPPGSLLEVGAMIESPGAVERIDAIVASADFVCIGTNDLTALTLGIARAQPEEGLRPEILTSIAKVVRAAHASNKEVTVCGELAAHPEGARILAGLHVDALSVMPSRVGPVKRALGETTLAASEAEAARRMEAASSQEERK